MEVYMIELKGQVAIVTGGANGIGRQICLEFAKAGSNIVVADIAYDKAKKVADEAKEFGVDAIAVQVDVTDEVSVNNMVDITVKTFGKLDVMCNNAGIITMKYIEDLPTEEWDRIMAVNAKGVFLCCKSAIPHMKKQGYGKIINTASQCGKIGVETLGHYCASKAAVILLTRTLALELAKYDILVNCVCPGNVWTDMTAQEAVWTSERTGKSFEEIKKEWAEVVPLKRYATPLDVARIFVFLASEYADYLTGDALNVTGGLTMI
jgi:meso-butanediol dehydrogenase/(S,S)-butanediol dehydrogenase/diacetyl reductase